MLRPMLFFFFSPTVHIMASNTFSYIRAKRAVSFYQSCFVSLAAKSHFSQLQLLSLVILTPLYRGGAFLQSLHFPYLVTESGMGPFFRYFSRRVCSSPPFSVRPMLQSHLWSNLYILAKVYFVKKSHLVKSLLFPLSCLTYED